jgi:hypothetical protein
MALDRYMYPTDPQEHDMEQPGVQYRNTVQLQSFTHAQTSLND